MDEHETLYEWVAAVANKTGIDEEKVWNITEKLLLEPNSMERIDKEVRLKVLYELHLNRWTSDENPPGSWVELSFDVDDEVESFQFSYGAFNLSINNQEDMNAMKAITREEDLHVKVFQPDAIGTDWMKCDPVWALRVTKRILDEVYGVSISDIKWAEEYVSWGENLTWEDVAEYR